jgi:hypothetical protein
MFSRRQFIKDVALTYAGLSIGPYFAYGKAQIVTIDAAGRAAKTEDMLLTAV